MSNIYSSEFALDPQNIFCFFVNLSKLHLQHLTNHVSTSFQLCADTNLTNMQRQLALEVIVTLSETAAAMLRKHTAIVAQSGEDLVHHQLTTLNL